MQDFGARQIKVFGRSFEVDNMNVCDKISQFYQVDNEELNDKIDGVNLCLLLFKNFQQNKLDMGIRYGLTIAFAYANIPIIWKLIIKDHSYNCRENWTIFAIQWLAMFMFKFFNWFLLRFVIIFFEMKIEFKCQIISMFDRTFAIN